MRNSKRAAAVVALAVSFFVSAVSVANATEPNRGTVTSAAAKAKPKTHQHVTPVHNKFVHAGTVTAVSPTSITITVHGGRYKALRGTPLTVVVTTTTKVSRNDAASTIASVKVGDHANIKGTKTAAVYTATRISASGL